MLPLRSVTAALLASLMAAAPSSAFRLCSRKVLPAQPLVTLLALTGRMVEFWAVLTKKSSRQRTRSASIVELFETATTA
jgi:hypothetical protein